MASLWWVALAVAAAGAVALTTVVTAARQEAARLAQAAVEVRSTRAELIRRRAEHG